MRPEDVVRPFGLKTYQKRRRELVKRLSKKSSHFAVLYWSGSELPRTPAMNFPFRADTDFLYLTGFSEPETMIILTYSNGKMSEAIGLRPRDLSPNRGSEIWEGERVGVERATKLLGFQSAFDVHQTEKVLKEKIRGVETVFWRTGLYSAWDNKILSVIKSLDNSRAGSIRVSGLDDPSLTVAQMRMRKSSEEIEIMRRSAENSARGHIRAMKSIRPGQYEYEVQAETEREFKRLGSHSTAYNSICATGNNACTLHYHANNTKIGPNDLYLMDAAGEYEGYASDITRAFPARGKFSEAQREIYELVLRAQIKAIEAVRPGALWTKPHETAIRILSEGLSKLRIIKKSPSEILKKGLWKAYMPHSTSHWIGMDVHDVGPYYDNKMKPLKLQVGNVLTIEPGLYFRADDKRVPAKYRGIGVRIEDDVAVGRSGPDVLSKNCPKKIEDIEGLRVPRL